MRSKTHYWAVSSVQFVNAHASVAGEFLKYEGERREKGMTWARHLSEGRDQGAEECCQEIDERKSKNDKGDEGGHCNNKSKASVDIRWAPLALYDKKFWESK